MMNMKEIRKMSGLSQSKFANKYEIPVRTIQDWETGRRSAPEYVLKLLEFKVQFDMEHETE